MAQTSLTREAAQRSTLSIRLHPSLGRLVAELEAQLVLNPVRSLHVDLPVCAPKKNVDATAALTDTSKLDSALILCPRNEVRLCVMLLKPQ